MWLRNVYLKSLRDYRIGILGWGIGMGLVVMSPMASVASLVSTPQARAELVGLAQQFSWNAAAIAVDTIGGYAMFKIGVFVFLIAVWPLLAAGRALRGEEERGSMDVLLSAPRSRARVAIEKIAAIWTALFAMGLLIGLLTFVGGQAFQGEFGLGDALLYGLDIALVCAVFAGITLVLSQFMIEGAAGWGGGLLVIFIVLDMVHRVFPDAENISRLSPIYYFNLSKPLVPSYGTNAGALLVLFIAAAALCAWSVWLFARRDIGATAQLPRWLRMPSRAAGRPDALPVRDWSLRSVYLRALATLVTPTIWWSLLIAGLAAWLVVTVQQIGKQLEELIAQSPVMVQFLQTVGGTGSSMNATFLSAMFQTLPILLMAFVVTQVNGWAADEENGRLDLILASPQSRRAVVLGRFAALSTAAVFIGLVAFGATVLAARVTGVALDEANVAAASLGAVPLGLLIGAAGYLGAGWLRSAADTGLLSFLLLAWFFITFIGHDLGWPDSALRLSAFYYYGNPLLKGLETANVVGLLTVAAVALALGVFRFTRKDIAV